MDHALGLDTSPEAERELTGRWRVMSVEDRLRIALGLSESVKQLALAGIRQRHPGASPREVLLRFAIVTLGRELAVAAYPDAAGLSPP